MTWTVGVSTGCCTERPIADALQSAARAGFDVVEVGTPPRHFNPFDPAQVARVRQRLTDLAIQPRSIHAPFGGDLDLSEPDENRRNAAVATLRQVATVLKHLGGDVMVVHPSDVARHAVNPAKRLECVVVALEQVSRACREIGVTLALETALPHLVGGHPDELGWLLARLDGGVGVCLDTGHVHLGHHLAATLHMAGPRLVHVHVHDNRGAHDDHLAPGDGSIAWADVFAGLTAAGYRGSLVLELQCPGATMLGDHYRYAAGRLRQLLARYAPSAV